MITKFYNANIVGFNNKVIKNGCLVLEGNKVSVASDDLLVNADKSVDVKGGVIMPALSNLMVDVKGNFNKILSNLVSNGVASCVFNGELSSKDLDLASKTLSSFGATINVNKLKNVSSTQLKKCFDVILPYGTPVIFIEDILNIAEQAVEQVYVFAKNNNAQVFVKVNESLESVGMCHNQTKQTPIELVLGYGLFDLNLTLFRCLSVDKYDLDILSENGAHVIITPVCDMAEGGGITPIVSLKEANVKLNIANTNTQDNFLNVLRIIKLTQSGYLNKKNAVSSQELINMATKTLFFNNNNFIVVECEQPFDLDEFILQENKKITQVYVNGKQRL